MAEPNAHLGVDLVAKDRTVWSGPAIMVSAPAAEGDIGILVGHAPLLSVLRAGSVRIKPADGARLEFQVAGGFLSVDSDQVTIVADAVEAAAPTAGTGPASH